MARSRNLKPGLYKNEDLAECSIWARYIFPGLWTMADREGRLEDRPKRIKGEILPYDSVEVEPLLVELERQGFIARYSVEGQRLIQILAFHRHQNPHKKEQASKLPAMPGFVPVAPAADDEQGAVKPEASGRISEAEAAGLFGAKGVSNEGEAPDTHGASTGHAPGLGAMEGGVSPADSLYSDSLYSDSPISDSLISKGSESSRGGKPPLPPGFARFWSVWPKHFRKESRGECLKAWDKAGAETIADAIIAHVERKKVSQEWTKDGGEYIPAPLVYLNKRRWEGAEGGDGSKPAPVDAEGRVWWQVAGFDSVDHAQNFRCHIGNFHEFREGKRIPTEASA